MAQINLLWINGWLGAAPSWALHQMRDETNRIFGNRIYSPEPINHNQTALFLKRIADWKDDVIAVGLSCGCSTINEAAKWVKLGERIRFAMYLSPSFPCGIGTRGVPPAVERAQEVNSGPWDMFNLGSRKAIERAPGNNKTLILPRLKTYNGHGTTPLNAQAQTILHNEIRRALA
jgi:hypothetical protein